MNGQRGPVSRSALARCITGDALDFGRDHWGRSPLLSRAADLPSDFADLLSPDSVDELIAERGVRTPFLRLAHEGSVLARDRFTSSGGFGAEMPDQIDSAKILTEFAAGATLVLQGLHRLWPPLIDFARDMVDDIGHPTQINAYITPASSRGFDAHYDVHDVFVLQVSGTKRWVLHPPVHQDPLTNQPWTDHKSAVTAAAATEPFLDVVLAEGDSLYVPRGWVHSATALGETSIHLTVGMSAFTHFDVLHHAIAELAQQAQFRAPLPLGIDPTDAASIRPRVAEVLRDLAAQLDNNDVDLDDSDLADHVARRIGRRFGELTRPEPVRPLHTVEVAQNLTEHTEVQWRRGLHARIVTGDAVRIELIDKSVTLPIQCDAAVRQLVDGKPCSPSSLTGLDAADGAVVITRLLREGIVVPTELS